MRYERVAPEEIERRSFEIITEELVRRGVALPEDRAFLIKRAIHATDAPNFRRRDSNLRRRDSRRRRRRDGHEHGARGDQ